MLPTLALTIPLAAVPNASVPPDSKLPAGFQMPPDFKLPADFKMPDFKPEDLAMMAKMGPQGLAGPMAGEAAAMAAMGKAPKVVHPNVPYARTKSGPVNPYLGQYRAFQDSLAKELGPLEALGGPGGGPGGSDFLADLKKNITEQHKQKFADQLSKYFEWEKHQHELALKRRPPPPLSPPPPAPAPPPGSSSVAIDELQTAIHASKKNSTHIARALHKVKKELDTAKGQSGVSYKVFIPIVAFLSLFAAVLGWTLYVISDGYQAAQLRKRGYTAVSTRMNPSD